MALIVLLHIKQGTERGGNETLKSYLALPPSTFFLNAKYVKSHSESWLCLLSSVSNISSGSGFPGPVSPGNDDHDDNTDDNDDDVVGGDEKQCRYPGTNNNMSSDPVMNYAASLASASNSGSNIAAAAHFYQQQVTGDI